DRWSKPVCNAPSNLGPPQLGGFFPVAARVFQIQSVFVPVHEPLLVRWPFRSHHSVYLRGKIPHPRAPNSVVNGCLAGFPLGRNTEPLIRAIGVCATTCRNTRKMTRASRASIAPMDHGAGVFLHLLYPAVHMAQQNVVASKAPA